MIQFIRYTVNKHGNISTYTAPYLYNEHPLDALNEVKHKKQWIGGELIKTVVYDDGEQIDLNISMTIN